MINILINNIRFVNPTSLIRALRQIQHHKIVIWGTDTKEEGSIASSNFVDHYIKASDIEDSDAYLSFMKKLCDDKNIQIIIPGSDKDVQFYSKYKHEFNAIIVVPSSDTAQLFYDKYEATLAIANLGLSVPEIVENLFNEKELIFRKKISSSSTGISVINLTEETYIPNLFNEHYFLQRFIKGTEYTVDVFADKNGIPKLILPRKRLEIRNGMSVCCQLVYHEKIIELCQMIYKQFYIPGLSNIQFIESGNDIYFIELNMRFAGSGICGIIASFNYLEQYIDHFLYSKELHSLEYYSGKVAWSSIISRYYDECVYSASESVGSKSYVQNDK